MLSKRLPVLTAGLLHSCWLLWSAHREDTEVSCRHKDSANLLYGCREWLYVYERGISSVWAPRIAHSFVMKILFQWVSQLSSYCSLQEHHWLHQYSQVTINELDVKKKKVDLLICIFNSATKFRVHPGAGQHWAAFLKSFLCGEEPISQSILVCAMGIKTRIYVTVCHSISSPYWHNFICVNRIDCMFAAAKHKYEKVLINWIN